MTYQPTDKKFIIASLLGLSLHRVYISFVLKCYCDQIKHHLFFSFFTMFES